MTRTLRDHVVATKMLKDLAAVTTRMLKDLAAVRIKL